ncbi:zinc ribbon domain-containing protein [Lysinibacillus sp. NPDC096396]|uniref:zinc ribbon domain-containing protein n=2 Tax=Lysinibacillus TaxID=400634 RepID=UPI00380F08CD
MEYLNVKGMMKNIHLAKAVAGQKLYEFNTKVKNTELNLLKPTDGFHIKTCCSCRQIKTDLKLKGRLYICSCGLKLDRDLNVSFNLANYLI